LKLIVGLGNPGPRYALTPHNIGFLLVDSLAQRWNLGKFRDEHRAQVVKASFAGSSVLLAKPQTFMNLSGESVRALIDFYKIDVSDVLVVHDEVDLPFSEMRFSVKRGPGGHNGIRSLHQHLGSDLYARLRLGVGRPPESRMAVADFLLNEFQVKDDLLVDFINKACEAVEGYLELGFERAANRFNTKTKE
jgi:peptidyl-tRNA hydrolase, PTH1 family